MPYVIWSWQHNGCLAFHSCHEETDPVTLLLWGLTLKGAYSSLPRHDLSSFEASYLTSS